MPRSPASFVLTTVIGVVGLALASCGGDGDPVEAFAGRFCPVAIGAENDVRAASAIYDPEAEPVQALTSATTMVDEIDSVLRRLTEALPAIDPPDDAGIDDYVATLRQATSEARDAARIAKEGLEGIPLEALSAGAIAVGAVNAAIRPLGSSLALIFRPPDGPDLDGGGILYADIPEPLVEAMRATDSCLPAAEG